MTRFDSSAPTPSAKALRTRTFDTSRHTSSPVPTAAWKSAQSRKLHSFDCPETINPFLQRYCQATGSFPVQNCASIPRGQGIKITRSTSYMASEYEERQSAAAPFSVKSNMREAKKHLHGSHHEVVAAICTSAQEAIGASVGDLSGTKLSHAAIELEKNIEAEENNSLVPVFAATAVACQQNETSQVVNRLRHQSLPKICIREEEQWESRCSLEHWPLDDSLPTTIDASFSSQSSMAHQHEMTKHRMRETDDLLRERNEFERNNPSSPGDVSDDTIHSCDENHFALSADTERDIKAVVMPTLSLVDTIQVEIHRCPTCDESGYSDIEFYGSNPINKVVYLEESDNKGKKHCQEHKNNARQRENEDELIPFLRAWFSFEDAIADLGSDVMNTFHQWSRAMKRTIRRYWESWIDLCA
jgi:hypothetical protein